MINSLTSFRFLTAFVVFLFHCNIHLQWRTGAKMIDRFFGNGACFMTGFFVLSGFIMMLVYENADFGKQKNIFDYYIKRFAKIYPTYIVGTIVYFCFFYDIFLEQPARIFFNDIFLLQGFSPSIFGVGINGGTWSLSVEMFLYFLFPFLVIVCNKNAKISLWGGGIICFFGAINSFYEPFSTIYANPVVRLGDFLMGISFYFLLTKFKNIKYAKMLHFLTIVLIFFAVLFLGKSKNHYMLGQPLIAPLFGTWICFVYYSKNWVYQNKIMIYLGQISYSFYIWQFCAMGLGKYLIKTEYFNIQAVVLICFLVNVLVSAVSYRFIEEFMRIKIIAFYKKIYNVN